MHEKFIEKSIEQAIFSVKNGTGPFGCVIVKNGEILAAEHNRVTENNDPTAHAEIQAIRAACKKLRSFQLTDCIIYTSCYPCAMCFGAIYWSRPQAVYYASTADDASAVGFDDSYIYEEITQPESKRKIIFKHLEIDNHTQPFKLWKEHIGNTRY